MTPGERALLHRILLLEKRLGAFIGGGATVTPHANQHEDGGSDELNVTGLVGTTGRLIGLQVITATGAGTYTPAAGTTSIVIELQGAGGGGGGCDSPTGTSVALARGGGGGGWLRKRLTANFSGANYSVGAKGTGGSAGNNAGTAGGNTTFTDTAGSPTTYTASGGGGGNGSGALTAPVIGGQATGGGATNGDSNRPGSASDNAFAISAAGGNIFGGRGGTSMYSPGAANVIVNGGNGSSAGAAADGKGGGGSGAVAQGTGAAAAGGDGSDGVIIIWEFA